MEASNKKLLTCDAALKVQMAKLFLEMKDLRKDSDDYEQKYEQKKQILISNCGGVDYSHSKNDWDSLRSKVNKWIKELKKFEDADPNSKRVPPQQQSKCNGVKIIPPIPLQIHEYVDVQTKMDNLVTCLNSPQFGELTLSTIKWIHDINNSIKFEIYNVKCKKRKQPYETLIKEIRSRLKNTHNTELNNLPDLEEILTLVRSTMQSDNKFKRSEDSETETLLETMDLLCYYTNNKDHSHPQPIHSDTPATSPKEFGDTLQFCMTLTDDSPLTTFYHTKDKITNIKQFATNFGLPPALLSKNKVVSNHISQWGRITYATPKNKISGTAPKFTLTVMDGGTPHRSPGGDAFRAVLFGTAKSNDAGGGNTNGVYENDQMTRERFWLIMIDKLVPKLTNGMHNSEDYDNEQVIQHLYLQFAKAVYDSGSERSYDGTLLNNNTPDGTTNTLKDDYFCNLTKKIAIQALATTEGNNDSKEKAEQLCKQYISAMQVGFPLYKFGDLATTTTTTTTSKKERKRRR